MWWINATFLEIDIRKYNVTNYLLLLHCDITTSLTYDPVGVYYYGGIYRILSLLPWNVYSALVEKKYIVGWFGGKHQDFVYWEGEYQNSLQKEFDMCLWHCFWKYNITQIILGDYNIK